MFVFDRFTQTEIGFNLCFCQCGDQGVGEGKNIRFRIIGIGIEIRKDIVDIHESAAAETTTGIVQTGVRHPRFSKIMKHGAVGPSDDGRLTDGIDFFHRTDDFVCIDRDFCHSLYSFHRLLILLSLRISSARTKGSE